MLGFINFNGAFTGFAFSDFLLDQVSGKGRGGGDPNDPWTHLQNRTSVFAQDDLKVTETLTVNLGLRWAYTSPLVEKDNRQSNFDLVTGQQIFAADGGSEDRALYKPYYKGYEPRVGAAWTATDRLVFRGGYGISQFMEGTGANLRLPLNPPLFFESAVTYDATTGPGTIRTGFAELVPGTTPSGNVRAYDPNLRPQFTHQWNAFVEYRLTPAMSAQVGYVGHNATHLVTPVEGNQALPGVGNPSTWAPKNTRRPLFRAQPLVTTIATTAARSGSKYNSMQASVRQRSGKRRRVPGFLHARERNHQQSRLLRRVRRHRTAGGHQRRRKAPIGRTRTTPRRSGDRRSTTSGTILSSRRPTNCRSDGAARSAPGGPDR